MTLGRSKKPGAPGKTTIPPEVVSSVTKRLLAEFRKRRYHMDHHLFVVAQQGYLYLEAARKEWGASGPRPPINRSSTTHIPLGRLRFLRDGEAWEFQPYRFSDEYWDDRETEVGIPEDLVLSMVVARLR
jgi:hypothetical protein